MKHFYSIAKKGILLLALGNWISYSAFSQTSVCGPVVQDFNNTGGTMAGFTSSALLSTEPGFTYGQTAQNGYLQRCNIPSAGTTYLITTATYQSAASQTYVGYGFDLSGQIIVSSVNVYVQYIDNNNLVNTVFDTTLTPSYTGSGNNATASICDSFLLSRATGFTAGERYRFVFEITAATASNNNQCIVFDNFRTNSTIAQSPLPVTFTGFTAKKSGSSVELIWNVTGEKDVAGYEVERGINGRNFQTIGNVAAANSNAYSFKDNQPINGIAFYRIREVDVDGSYRYTTIVRVNLSAVVSLRAYPSPAKDVVTFEHAVTTKGTLTISTSEGRMIKQINIQPQAYQTSVNISNWPSGLYIVRFSDGSGNTETTKLIKE